jgi:hypothetical protein
VFSSCARRHTRLNSPCSRLVSSRSPRSSHLSSDTATLPRSRRFLPPRPGPAGTRTSCVLLPEFSRWIPHAVHSLPHPSLSGSVPEPDALAHRPQDPRQRPRHRPVPHRVRRSISFKFAEIAYGIFSVQCNGYTDGGFATAPAAAIAPVAAGSQVKLTWTTWPDSHLGKALISSTESLPHDHH